MNRHRFSTSLFSTTLLALSIFGVAAAQESDDSSSRLTRLVWQDYETKTLQWGDVVRDGDSISLRTAGAVEQFPKLDAKRQELVQMERVGRTLLVGVRDDTGGDFESGWAYVDLGAGNANPDSPNGDAPRTLATALSESQGNPAHLYVYDRIFYLANDALNGFTRLDPVLLENEPETYRGSFHRGGGGHITLAAADGKVVYGTWIGGEGPRKGRVDVTDLGKPFDRSIAYSFFLPSGGLHGATTNSGKVFFAPSDGISWVAADPQLKLKAEQVQPTHLSLGTDEETKRPLRTGAFANHESWTLFTTGRDKNAALCLLDASATEPKIVKLSIPTEQGLSLVTPETVVTEGGKRFAFVFQDRLDGEAKEKLTIVDLDPNGDGDLSDAREAKTLEVGASKVTGHYGHHAIAFDELARHAFIANPGDGEIWMVSLADFDVVNKFDVGGMPTTIVAFGGQQPNP